MSCAGVLYHSRFYFWFVKPHQFSEPSQPSPFAYNVRTELWWFDEPRRCYELSEDMSNGFDEIMKHENRKSQEMQTAESLRCSLEVTRQSAKTCGPGKTTFHHPASWQKDESFLGFG